MLTRRLREDQRGFHLIELVVVLLVLGVIAFVFIKVTNNKDNVPNPDKRGPNYHALQKCSNQPLTTLPMDLSRLEFIAGLGGLNPPDHTLPTDHMYMMYPYGDKSQKEIRAPASGVITSVSYGSTYENGVLESADYAINFYPCRELKLIFGHVDSLGDKFASQVDPNKPGTECNTSTQGKKEIKNCFWDVDINLSAGELLGTADGWDFWATYEGFVSPKVISPRYYHNVDAVCPLDYFTDDLKQQLYAKLRRDGEPKCGEAYQDKAGTLQGGWFGHKDPEKAKTDWSSHFALAHDPTESGIGVLAIAGTIVPDDFMIRFTPKHSGTINREPSETTSGTVYCYQHEGDRRFRNGYIAGDGKILLKLIDNHTMQIEHKTGACTASESFSSPTTHYR